MAWCFDTSLRPVILQALFSRFKSCCAALPVPTNLINFLIISNFELIFVFFDFVIIFCLFNSKSIETIKN